MGIEAGGSETRYVRELLKKMFNAAVAAAQPESRIPPHLPNPPRGRLIVIGAGKASAAMARTVENCRKGALEGLVGIHHAHNNGHGFFEALNDSLVTGPTLTNVNDFRAIFIPGEFPAAPLCE